jgi:hypothetical protein
MGPVVVLEGLGGRNANSLQTVPIPRCLRAVSSTLCKCRRTGLLVADDVCPGDCMAAQGCY